MNNSKNKPEDREQVKNCSEQEQKDLEKKPAKKKTTFEFKEEDMVSMTYDF